MCFSIKSTNCSSLISPHRTIANVEAYSVAPSENQFPSAQFAGSNCLPFQKCPSSWAMMFDQMIRLPSSRKDRSELPDELPGTFDLLGFTHYWARSRNGYWVVKQKTAADRFSRAVGNIDEWCHDNRLLPIDEQHKKLNEKLRGHYVYYGVTGNSGSLTRFLHEVGPRWRKWLNRRRSMT